MLEVSRAYQGISTRCQTRVDQFDEYGIQRVIDVKCAGEVPAMNGPLKDSHAQQFAAGQVTHGVGDGALQGAGLPECGDHLGRAVLKLFQRVITDVEGVQKRTKLVSAAAVEKINVCVTSADDVCQQFSYCPFRAWRRQRQVLSADVGQPPREFRPRAVELLETVHACET